MSIPSLEKPLVTVAMVTYNSSEYVRVAIESVLKSTYGQFELIISDDCSKDNTWDIIQEIIQETNDFRIKASQNEQNLGEYRNRNKCIDLAIGKYILFIDGDDIMYSNALEVYLKAAQAIPECGMVIQKGYINNIVFPVMLSSSEVFYLEFFGKGILSSSFSSNFFRIDVLRELGKLSTKFIGGDNEIRYKIALNYPVLFISGWLTWPRETPGQASSRLNGSVGIIESIELQMGVLKNALFPLNPLYSKEAEMLILKRLGRYIIKCILKLQFDTVIFLIKRIKAPIFKLLAKSTHASEILPSLFNYSPQNPRVDNTILFKIYSNEIKK